jgi:uncharacterized membrane protein
MEDNQTEKTALGLKPNLEAALTYSVGFISGVVFLFLEKENQFVRFHALQSVVTFLGLFIVSLLIGLVPFIGFIVSLLSMPLTFILWIFLMYKAYQGEHFKLPYIGDFTEQQLAKIQ